MSFLSCKNGPSGGASGMTPTTLFEAGGTTLLSQRYTITAKHSALLFAGGGGIGGSSPQKAYPYPYIVSGNGTVEELYNKPGASGDAYARGVLYLIKDYDVGTVIGIKNGHSSTATYSRSCYCAIIGFD